MNEHTPPPLRDAKRERLRRTFAPTGLGFLDAAKAHVLARIDAALPLFTERFPEPSSHNLVYAPMDNTEWTNGFWTGMLWLAYELTGAGRYRAAAERQVESFHHRIVNRIQVDHHDLGFLYTLSCVAAYRLTGAQVARNAALEAAEVLLSRYLPGAGIIQAWGDLADPEQAGRMIIDCNLNLPLLFWATEETGDARFRDAATTHIKQAQTYIVRPDHSTFHTFYLDPVTGTPRHGATHQGFSDHSCWSRGQAWGISGFPLTWRYLKDASLIETSASLANYFLNRLPDDLVCCWDLVFTGGQDQRDSSAAAIAAAGLLELGKGLDPADPDAPAYRNAAVAITQSLARLYALPAGGPGNGQLKHAVYHMPRRMGIDECCIWGDYFYLETLVRLGGDWQPYW